MKDNSGNGNGNSGNNGNGSDNNKENSKSEGTDDAGYGNVTNAEEHNSQNQSGILFPAAEEISRTETDLIAMIKTTGKEKDYELIEYILNVNTQYTQVLMELNENGAMDAVYTYGVSRLTEDRFTGESNFYLYDPAGNVAGITDQDGYLWQSYRYDAFGNATFGSPQYDNEYTFNAESYNPNIQSQYLRARYYDMVKGNFLTEDSYLGDIRNPLTLNRYSYCIGNPLFYSDPSGHLLYHYEVTENVRKKIKEDFDKDMRGSKLSKDELDELYDDRLKFYEFQNHIGWWDSPFYRDEDRRIDYIVGYDFSSNKQFVKECVRTVEYLSEVKKCIAEEERKLEVVSKIDAYLAGNISEKEAQKYIAELAKTGALYGGKYITSVKSYKSDYKNRDYDRFDTQIIGWVAYYNIKNPEYSINTEWVKAMIYEESRYGYVYNDSPNANASRDIMQTLDPRNPTIFGYVNVDIDKTYVAGSGYKDESDRKKW